MIYRVLEDARLLVQLSFMRLNKNIFKDKNASEILSFFIFVT